MNKANNYFGFINACENGHLEIVKYLWKMFKDLEMNKSYNYSGFKNACDEGHL